MGDKKKFALNFAAQIAVLGTQFIISFVLTPIVLQKLGDEAYGFVGLVNNFVFLFGLFLELYYGICNFRGIGVPRC